MRGESKHERKGRWLNHVTRLALWFGASGVGALALMFIQYRDRTRRDIHAAQPVDVPRSTPPNSGVNARIERWRPASLENLPLSALKNTTSSSKSCKLTTIKEGWCPTLVSLPGACTEVSTGRTSTVSPKLPTSTSICYACTSVSMKKAGTTRSRTPRITSLRGGD